MPQATVAQLAEKPASPPCLVSMIGIGELSHWLAADSAEAALNQSQSLICLAIDARPTLAHDSPSPIRVPLAPPLAALVGLCRMSALVIPVLLTDCGEVS